MASVSMLIRAPPCLTRMIPLGARSRKRVGGSWPSYGWSGGSTTRGLGRSHWTNQTPSCPMDAFSSPRVPGVESAVARNFTRHLPLPPPSIPASKTGLALLTDSLVLGSAIVESDASVRMSARVGMPGFILSSLALAKRRYVGIARPTKSCFWPDFSPESPRLPIELRENALMRLSSLFLIALSSAAPLPWTISDCRSRSIARSSSI